MWPPIRCARLEIPETIRPDRRRRLVCRSGESFPTGRAKWAGSLDLTPMVSIEGTGPVRADAAARNGHLDGTSYLTAHGRYVATPNGPSSHMAGAFPDCRGCPARTPTRPVTNGLGQLGTRGRRRPAGIDATADRRGGSAAPSIRLRARPRPGPSSSSRPSMWWPGGFDRCAGAHRRAIRAPNNTPPRRPGPALKRTWLGRLALRAGAGPYWPLIQQHCGYLSAHTNTITEISAQMRFIR